MFTDAPTATVTRLLLDKQDAAAALGISERKLHDLTRPRGELPVIRIGRLVRYSVADLQEWIARQPRHATEGEFPTNGNGSGRSGDKPGGR